MKKLFVFLCFLTVCISRSSALKCYLCMETDGSCEKVNADTSTTECFAPAPNTEAFCTKVVLQGSGLSIVLRNCVVSINGINPCTLLEQAAEHCSVCNTELCNSAKRSSVSLWSTFVALFSLIVFSRIL